MNRLLIISGPTATGKTSLAFFLAKTFYGELVSADSRQVYRGMNIVTGKEVDEDVKTWLLDVVDPDQPFTVAGYHQLAWPAIQDVLQRKKLPIIVGGTGFYIKTLLEGIGTMGIKPDWELRGKLDTLTVKQLQEKLKKLDALRLETMNKSDSNNPRRLIRAIEISIHLGGVHSATPEVVRRSQTRLGRLTSRPQLTSGMNIFWIGLTAPSTILYQRIDQRVDERVREGAVEETKLLAERYGWDSPSMTGQGYRELRSYIEGEISLKEAVKRWKFAEHAYARKQMTWFKKEKRIVWLDITQKDLRQKVTQTVDQWYTM